MLKLFKNKCALLLNIWLLLQSIGFSQPTVVLLTSLDLNIVPGKSILGLSSSDRMHQVVHQFSKAFKPLGYKIAVIHKSDSHILFSALNHPDVVAIFWLSHGSFQGDSESKDSISLANNFLIDHQGFDVSPVFSSFSSSIKYISIISCNSQEIMKPIFNANLSKIHQGLKIQLFSGKIEALKGMEISIEEALPVLTNMNDSKENSPKNFSGSTFQIIRRINSKTTALTHHKNEVLFPALRIELEGKVLGTLEAFKPQSNEYDLIQNKQITWSEMHSITNGMVKNLIITMGNYGLSEGLNRFSMGEIGIVPFSTSMGVWKLFVDANGEPFGTFERLFQFEPNGFIR